MRTKYIYFVSLVTITTLFVSCGNSYYPKVSESLCIINNSDTTIIVEYRFDSLPSYFYKGVKDTIPSKMASRKFIQNNTEDLWIREAAFEKLIAQIRIYRIENNDTIFIDKSLYNKRIHWNYFYNRDFESISAENTNSLTVKNEMFNK